MTLITKTMGILYNFKYEYMCNMPNLQNEKIFVILA